MQCDAEQRYGCLLMRLEGYGSALVAYSGGADSTLLAIAAHEALGPEMVAVLAVSPLLLAGEEERARAMAGRFDFPLEVITHPGFERNAVRYNYANRCYYCKLSLSYRLQDMAAESGLSEVLCGDNVDDLEVYRPGRTAVRDLGVRSPLADEGITKAEVRSMLKMLGAPNHSDPASACLATRFPVGCELTPERLDVVREAERRASAFADFAHLRVRCDCEGNARIELSMDDRALLSDGDAAAMLAELETLPFESVVFDIGTRQ